MMIKIFNKFKADSNISVKNKMSNPSSNTLIIIHQNYNTTNNNNNHIKRRV